MIAELLVCLALNGYHEARGEPTAGELAVNHVVMNRVADPRYKSDICSVVKDGRYWNNNPVRNKCHFSWWCDGKSDTPRDGNAWIQSTKLASGIVSGYYPDITDGATHYHNVGVSPNWIDDRGMKRIGIIGEHVFYRWE